MSQENRQSAAQEKTQTILDGPLKHVKAAALAAALVPLASIAATPAEAQVHCGSASICGVVWADTNNNGIQDPGEGVIEGAVLIATTPDGNQLTFTDQTACYYFACRRRNVISSDPPGTQVSPADEGGDDTMDSDGESDGLGNSVATSTISERRNTITTTDFGFSQTPVQQPGTGTPVTGRIIPRHGQFRPSPSATQPTRKTRRCVARHSRARTRR